MKKLLIVLCLALLISSGTAHAIPLLAEYLTLNQGGSVVNISAFDTGTGLGTVTMTFSGAGSKYGGLYVDHELNEGTNSFFNEFGRTSGATAPGGVSWQIDEPGWGNPVTGYTGDIYSNFEANVLNYRMFDGLFNGPEDVSMAMIRAFDLLTDQTAILSFTISASLPSDPDLFYLAQSDGDPGLGDFETLYFTSDLNIRDIGEPVPEPSTILLLGAGLLGLGVFARKRR